MASYALLLALSGFEFDSVKEYMGFNPCLNQRDEFRCFWSLGSGWGIFKSSKSQVSIQVKYGKLKLKRLKLPFLKGRKIESILVDGKSVGFKEENGEITLDNTCSVCRELVIQLSTNI
jgi:non-lysosomal glucosylceramidase